MPRVIVLAGINGAGKTTASANILREQGVVDTFVNADIIARGLNGLNPESVALSAGKVMLQRLEELAEDGENFALETTLSGRNYYSWLKKLKLERDYRILMYYYWLRSPELAIERVAARVRSGGHHVPEATIRQRYHRSVSNFLNLYRPLLDEWEVYDNSNGAKILIALGNANDYDAQSAHEWSRFERSAAPTG